ncbi:hypothetical protein DD509_08385 [Dehalogenimonas alkenigignens]|nr:hypothetical protein DD509_08385 [Dehalogenimonas alkenigignens]
MSGQIMGILAGFKWKIQLQRFSILAENRGVDEAPRLQYNECMKTEGELGPEICDRVYPESIQMKGLWIEVT